MDKIICIGKNYLEHAQELAKQLGDSIPEKPVLFLKPPSSLIQITSQTPLKVLLPTQHGSVHHECEIAVKIDKAGQITHVTLGLDMTLRDLQTQLKKNGHPWEIGKVFKNAVILGPWIAIENFKNYLDVEFEFSINGNIKQKSTGNKMRLAPQQCLELAAEYFPLCDGDIVMTGTPEGVGPVAHGQTGQLHWSDKLNVTIQF